MSVDVPTTVEETPVPVTKEVPAAAPLTAAPATTTEANNDVITTAPTAGLSSLLPESTTQPIAGQLNNDETVAEAKGTTEGVLGYKEPGFLKGLRYQKHFFWFSDEQSTSESLTNYTRLDKSEHRHHNASYARETGKGVLFFSKRIEDRTTPAGMIMLADASNVIKDGYKEFSMRIGSQHHRFETATNTERDSWVAAIEARREEAKAMKEEVTGRESYENNLKEYGTSANAVPAGFYANRSRSRGAKKAIEPTASPATASVAGPVAAQDVKNHEVEGPGPNGAAVDPATVGPLGTLEPTDNTSKHSSTKKDRSQSRKRASIFGSVFGKKEDKDEQKELKKEEKAEEAHEKKIEKEVIKEHKAEEKAEKHAEKEAIKEHNAEEKAEKHAEHAAIKEHKKEEAELRKEEAHAAHGPSKPVEAAEVGAVAAVPAAVEEERLNKEELVAPSAKAKRSSVFGGFFGRKMASPSVERSEHEGGLSNDVAAVPATAPKLDEPIENKPIDTAAVTAPVDTVQTPPAVQETAREPSNAGQKTEKKGGLLGFIKNLENKQEQKKEAKEETKEETAITNAVNEPIAAPVTNATTATPAMMETPATTTAPATMETSASTTTPATIETSATTATPATIETPAEAAAEAKEERPAREKRRTSLFGSLGTLRRKNAAETNANGNTDETKREKSPLPSKLGSLFRKPSKAVRSEKVESEKPVETVKRDTFAEDKLEGDATTNGEVNGVDNMMPQENVAPFHEAVTTAPAQEVQASA